VVDRFSFCRSGRRGLGDRLGTAELPVFELVDRALVRVALLLAVVVDEGIGLDAVQPGLEVGPLLELAESGVRLDERLLHEIGGVSGIAGHPHRCRVQLVHERQGLFFEQVPWVDRLDVLLGAAVGEFVSHQRPV
jgi:hypothetical protein